MRNNQLRISKFKAGDSDIDSESSYHDLDQIQEHEETNSIWFYSTISMIFNILIEETFSPGLSFTDKEIEN